MCEWLSCEEWCDVFLLCGGRMFSAHRAVLASVSKFLRKVLLSCPYDETPAFIVMPEFDFEIMSSAMHYIYNGEVVVGKHQLDTFLDIMNALQIFVDTRNLLKVSQFNKSFCIDNEEHTIKESIVPAYLSCEDENIVTLKKEAKKECNIKFWNDNINPAQSTSDSDCFKSKSIWAGYLKSLGDRQRRPFSRDLFIETYCLNRNGNGVTEGVLAISNERYQEPASVSKTNANVENLSEIQHETSHKNTENNLNSIYKSTKPINISKKETYKNFDDISIKNNTDIGFDNFYKTNLLRHIQGDETLEKYMDQELKCYSINNNLIRSPNNFVLNSNNIEEEHSRSCEIGKDFNKNKEAITRVTILNEVLQCPWRPRLPDTFSPFPKNSINLRPEKAKNLQLKQNVESINDTNNNNNKPTKIKRNDDNESNDEKEIKQSAEKKEEHMRGHTSTGYTCTECRKSFSQLRNYKYHMSVHRGTKEFATTCPVCGKFFNDKGYLSSHMKIHRNRKEYKCSVCPKSFNQRVAYNMHVRIHTGVKPHVCEECGKAFSRKMLLKQHQRTHSGERPYECPHCSKRFADRSNMTLHLRLHTGIKPFTCSLCPKSFTKKHHLKSHLNFHTGDKPYICPRCKLAFTQSSNMRTHMKKCNVYLEEYQ